MKVLAVSLTAALVLAGCGSAGRTVAEPVTSPPDSISMSVRPATIPTRPPTPGPRPRIRPIGRLNPAVTQATIKKTVCAPGWTAKIRPPTSYTDALKRKQLAAGLNPADFEEDHLMPLSLGGAPTNPKNLWPVPWKRAKLDDVWETRLHRELCAGKVTLADAQALISTVKRRP